MRGVSLRGGPDLNPAAFIETGGPTTTAPSADWCGFMRTCRKCLGPALLARCRFFVIFEFTREDARKLKTPRESTYD